MDDLGGGASGWTLRVQGGTVIDTLHIILHGGRQGEKHYDVAFGCGPTVQRPIMFKNNGIYYEEYRIIGIDEMNGDYHYQYIGLKRLDPLYLPKRPVPLPD